MKTLSVALLLLFVCCCSSMPAAVHQSTGPEQCCFKFSTVTVPAARVAGIIQTHPGCKHRAFIVSTVKGRQICFNDDSPWAKKIFNQKNSEGSG
ncbi:C-C motif chemokine 4 homolog isoform X3 [Oryzias melastigma]|uniref:C-C motif chemokine 4 homolog isoform X3 n=1 Tax=Oryzias melastigma TaxID=30732 RepID=UPI000CF7C9F5|nr:C-C motif chemokine 4 homolog isoform X3 [Oryzias melastigma]